MSTDELERAVALRRQSKRIVAARYRLRKAGKLPPVPICRRCQARCFTDEYLPLCSLCARHCGTDLRQRTEQFTGKRELRPLRLMAEQILVKLRQEQNMTDCNQQSPVP